MNVIPPDTENIFPAPNPPNSNTKTLYISGFTPQTNSNDILAHIASQGLENVNAQCAKLVSVFKKAKNLSFVSFKVTVKAEFFEDIANPLIWPEGVMVREFVKKLEKTHH